MSEYIGNDYAFGFKVNSNAWGGAAAVLGAGDGVYALPGGDFLKKQPLIKNPELGRGAYPRYAELGMIDVSGGKPLRAMYRGLEPLLAAFFGTAAAPAQQGATTAYLHALTMKANLDGIHATIAENMQTHVRETPTAKLKGFELAWTQGDPVTITPQFVGNDQNNNVASGQNDLTSIANLTVPGDGTTVFGGDLALWINSDDGTGVDAALDSADAILPLGGTLKMERPLGGFYGPGGGKALLEPKNGAGDGEIMVMLTLNMPRWDDAAYTRLTEFYALTTKKASLKFTGALIESTYYYYLEFLLPYLRFTEKSEAELKKGDMPSTVQLEGELPGSAPLGMSSTQPALNIMSTRTTGALS